ncbi:oxidoreductase [Amycolatopsis sp. NPDC088138]|uniref:oxidoreductase n=1 Tax=Amycolatopsis sp. NPDC088138 TaxID=3363938 RepID=UPI003826E7A8
MTKTWFITGAARGLGAEIAKSALAAGDNVVATARDSAAVEKAFPGAGDQLLAHSLDVTDPEGPAAVVEAALARFGSIDVLVNNAGYGLIGIFEETPEEEVQRQFDTNVLGLMRITRAVLPTMRKQRAGRIINFSSIAGVVPFALCVLYTASKFAVAGFSANLALDVKSLGIKVTSVEPGYFRTDFLDSSSAQFSDHAIDDYAAVRDETESFYKAHNHQQLGDPAKLGPAIVELANAAEPPLHLLLGSDALESAREEYQARLAELDAWAELSRTTDGEAVS